MGAGHLYGRPAGYIQDYGENVKQIIKHNDYEKYSPMTVFKEGRGPQFHALSFGLYF